MSKKKVTMKVEVWAPLEADPGAMCAHALRELKKWFDYAEVKVELCEESAAGEGA